MELKVGKKVAVIKIGDNARFYRNHKLEVPIEEYTVVKVGRKYYYLDGDLINTKFSKERNVEVTGFNPGYRVYESKESIIEAKKVVGKASYIRGVFGSYNSKLAISDKCIKDVYDIMKKDEAENGEA